MTNGRSLDHGGWQELPFMYVGKGYHAYKCRLHFCSMNVVCEHFHSVSCFVSFCRDSRNMTKNVHSALTDVLEKFLSSRMGSEVTLASQPALEKMKMVLMMMKEEGHCLVMTSTFNLYFYHGFLF